MTEHVPGRVERQEFHRELGAVEAKVIELFTMVAEDLPLAADALLNGNSEVARALAERDRVIDAAVELSSWIKSHEFPVFPSDSFDELNK